MPQTKKFLKGFVKILKWLLIVLVAIIVLFFIVRFIGQRIYDRTPEGGINEALYVDINGTKQWISIYGQDKDNPVLLYLHGGPGSATSPYDMPSPENGPMCTRLLRGISGIAAKAILPTRMTPH